MSLNSREDLDPKAESRKYSDSRMFKKKTGMPRSFHQLGSQTERMTLLHFLQDSGGQKPPACSGLLCRNNLQAQVDVIRDDFVA